MPLQPGDKLGPYEIQALIGRGGMGEVWKAHDPRLKRDVAIKVSAAQFSERFEREAQAIAALNHPHICQLYDVGPNYLVMEFIEGAPLKGPLPLADALRFASQIASALDAAHKKGITHRDLNPANILVTKAGIKLLDFGLAKLTAAKPSPKPNDATLTMALTGKNEIVGTLYYMSPEQLQSQATGQEIDARSDIFSFGLVLYEILTGQRAFAGASPASVIAAIMERPAPSIADIAPPLDRVLKRCLEKDPDNRWQSARDLKAELDWIASAPSDANPPSRYRMERFLWIAAALLAVVALLGWMRGSRETAPPVASNDIAFSIAPPSGKALLRLGSLYVDKISPDGSMLLFRASGRYYIRNLNSLETQALPEINFFGDSFWAPDSQSIALPTDGGRLTKMRVRNGSPEPITKDMIGAARGGSWGEKGIVLLAQTDPTPGGVSLYSLPAEGGKPVRVGAPGLPEGAFYCPEFLPGGEDFLFEFVPAGSEAPQVYLATLRDGKAVNPQMLLNNETAASYTPAAGGRLLFVRNDNLYSQRLDIKARKLSGDAELLQERVASYAGWRNANFSVSRNGTLAWRSGTAVVSQIAVLDRKGKRIGIAGTPAPGYQIRLSPDESHLLASGPAGVWIVEADGPGRVSLPGGRFDRASWSPDGSKLIFTTGTRLFEEPVAGSGQVRQLAEIPTSVTTQLNLGGISPDGQHILFGDGTGLFSFALGTKGTPARIVAQRADNAGMSPDGTWIVYKPNLESGVYAQPISGAGLPKQIAGSGNAAVWRGDGKEILYFDQDQIWSVRVEGSGERLQFSKPQALFPVSTPLGMASGSRPLAVNRDGSRVYFLQSIEEPDAGVIDVRTGAVR